MLDLNHGLLFALQAKVNGSDNREILSCAGLVVTPGAKQKPGQTRWDLEEGKAQISAKIAPDVVRVAPDVILLMAPILKTG